MRRSLVAVAILTIAGCAQEPAVTGGSQYIATANGPLEFQFPAGWYIVQKDNPYDLQCMSKDDRMTTGVFLFTKADLAENANAHKLLQLQIDDLRSKRQDFDILEETQTVQVDKKTLTSVVYSGEKEATRFYYRFTLVEFAENPDMVAVVLQVAIPSYWTKHKPILEGITRSARVKSEAPPKQQ